MVSQPEVLLIEKMAETVELDLSDLNVPGYEDWTVRGLGSSS
jgi:hypothetical protein